MSQRAILVARPVLIDMDGVGLAADLAIPAVARGLVVFVHGSGSNRHSPRSRFVADELGEAGLATLLLDLLTREEDRIDSVTAEFRFDVELLANRVISAIDWVAMQDRPLTGLPIGLFGASTGAAAAMVAAAARPKFVRAVVSRGGRPDLANDALPKVLAPTLLIVGSEDAPVLDLNREALDRMTCERQIRLVPGASHLFEEQGTLDVVAALASSWYLTHLPWSGPWR